MAESIASKLITPIQRPSLERTRLRSKEWLVKSPGDVAFVLAVCFHAANTELIAIQADLLSSPPTGEKSPYDAPSRRPVMEAYSGLVTSSTLSDIQTAITELQAMGLGTPICALLREHLDPISPQHVLSAVSHILIMAARLKE